MASTISSQQRPRPSSSGCLPRAIAANVNARGLATINGNADRGNGVIHNELYRGTGARSARRGDPANIVRQQISALRILPEELWPRSARATKRPGWASSLASVRPKHLLSDELKCGCCSGPMIRSGAELRFVCSWRRERGQAACDNGRGVKGRNIADQVLTALKDRRPSSPLPRSKARLEGVEMRAERRNLIERVDFIMVEGLEGRCHGSLSAFTRLECLGAGARTTHHSISGTMDIPA